MDYISFRNRFIEGVAFSTRQLKLLAPNFPMCNLYRWVEKGYMIKLRNGYYAFSERIKTLSDRMFISQLIYHPSYVSLQSAFAFYGLIPEAVLSITAVTTLKTNRFENSIGVFDYQTVSKDLFLGV